MKAEEVHNTMAMKAEEVWTQKACMMGP
jgi:hypothetical protein